jgi:hypothetical protein
MKKLIILSIFFGSCYIPKIKEVVPHVVTNIDTNQVFDPVTQQYHNMYIIKIDDSINTCVSRNTYKLRDTVNFLYYGH